MTTDTIEPKPCDRSAIFELAKEIYALHCAIKQLTHIPTRGEYRDKLVETLNHKTKAFASCGGIIETGVDVFGEKGPILSYPAPKEVIPYEIGRLRCEKLLDF